MSRLRNLRGRLSHNVDEPTQKVRLVVEGSPAGWLGGAVMATVRFDQTCANSSCSPPGPVRIKTINP